MPELLGPDELSALLQSTTPDEIGIARILETIGFSLIPPKDRPLDVATILGKGELRAQTLQASRLFAESGSWKHPISDQVFHKEALIVHLRLADGGLLGLRWPFEITRYLAMFSFPTGQAVFFFTAPNSRSVVVTSYTQSLTRSDVLEVRRLMIELDNVTRTDVDSLLSLVGLSKHPEAIVEGFRQALPYHKVGEGFFGDYHTLFQELAAKLRPVLQDDPAIYGYVQRLLGKMAFLYFLQRKGWLDGRKDYLKRFRKASGSKGLFPSLYRLFARLNGENGRTSDLGNIPFLNGSLFEKEAVYPGAWARVQKVTEPLLGKVFDIFDSYNFTISESTPLNKEVAVDPELLGSIFESMLPETERGDKGTFYTHQEEMLFMAREGLRNHLEGYAGLLNKEQVYRLVYGVESSTSKIEPRIAREMMQHLRGVMILDPAVGSGGFLMAAMQVLLDVRRRLNAVIGAHAPDYDMKLEIIERNLFGVDLEEEAIELARLRLWLSLVVDETLETIRPLPNLDYNLHSGDSLVSPAYDRESRQLTVTADHATRRALLREIELTREKYSYSHGKDKEQRRRELEEALRRLVKIETGKNPPSPLPFSYRYFFPDVMSAGGFDIILMNPPYVRQEDIGRLPELDATLYKEALAEEIHRLTDGDFVPSGQSDISVYFQARALSLLKNRGTAVVIASSKWLDVRYGAPLQYYLLKHARLDFIFDCSVKSFSADVNTAITVMRKDADGVGNNMVRFVLLKHPYKEVTGETIYGFFEQHVAEGVIETDRGRIALRTQDHLLEDGLLQPEMGASDVAEATAARGEHANSVYVGSKWGNLYFRAPKVFFEIRKRAGDRLKPLSGVCAIRFALKTACNDYFVLRRDEAPSKGIKTIRCMNGLGHSCSIEKEFLPSLLRNPDEITGFIQNLDALSYHVFLCRKSMKELEGSGALEYITWAEKSPDALVTVLRGKDKGKRVRISQLESIKSKKQRWYELKEIEPTTVFLPLVIKNRHLIPASREPVVCTNNFFPIYHTKDLDAWLYFSSSIFRLFMEIYGRTEGAGALQVNLYEYRQCPFLDPLPPIAGSFKHLKDFQSREQHRIVNIVEEGDLEFRQEDRRELDNLILQSLGFTEVEERKRVLAETYTWLIERTKDRLLKPRSAPKEMGEGLSTLENTHS